MFGEFGIAIAIFGVVTCIVLLIGMFVTSPGRRVSTRMADVANSGGRGRRQASESTSSSALPRMGEMLMPQDESRLQRLKQKMLQAGLYRKHSTALYLGVKFLLMVAPMGVGLALSSMGLLTFMQGILFGVLVGLCGTLLPMFWLSHLKSNRQRSIRRALPDALDVIVVCVEGGLSLPAALAKVATELRFAHPLLAKEMSIMRREIQLGRTSGEALRQFADRFDAEEIRSLSSVVSQAERFGASVVKALRVHADTLRIKRYQRAEAMAQKAPVKLIFPTVLCIFPALYIVLMGPAGVQILDMLEKLGN